MKIKIGKALPLYKLVPIPEVVQGEGTVARIGELALKMGIKKPLIVTDEILMQQGFIQDCMKSLESNGLSYALYDKVLPNPTTEQCNAGLAIYQSEKCDSLIAFGGGSPMDCCKMIGCLVSNPQPMASYAGFGKATLFGLRKIPPLIAVPTTAGTGSETSAGAVVTLAEKKLKVVVADFGLVPKVAVLDPVVVKNLPQPITAATGMDALTHAVESYLSVWRRPASGPLALYSVERVFKYLLRTYDNGHDMEAREQMLRASFDAASAFNMTNLGYVHAIAHQFGGLFHTPHGVANCMVLPLVLDFFADGPDALVDDLANLAIAAGLGSHYETYDEAHKRALGRKFIAKVREMSAHMKVPTYVEGMKKEHVDDIVTRAFNEAHGLNNALDFGYPIPKYLTHADAAKIVSSLLPPGERPSKL